MADPTIEGRTTITTTYTLQYVTTTAATRGAPTAAASLTRRVTSSTAFRVFRLPTGPPARQTSQTLTLLDRALRLAVGLIRILSSLLAGYDGFTTIIADILTRALSGLGRLVSFTLGY
jgi:hypothetical protein